LGGPIKNVVEGRERGGLPSNIWVMWVKPCHKPLIWEWFTPPIYGDDWGMVLFYCFTHMNATGEN
jgi:hypothetical protein